MSEGFTFKSPAELTQALMALRAMEQQLGPAKTQTIIPPTRLFSCASCNQRKKLSDMRIIETTGVVGKVVDCFCSYCFRAHKRQAEAMTRVVCATCRETVLVVEPHKEKTGFVWQPGGYCHVAKCPVCTDDPKLKASPIAEKIAFYKARGIPYE